MRADPPIIYLDDCADDDEIVTFARQRGLEVRTPRQEGSKGCTDQQHLEIASSHGYILLTYNAQDFAALHREWRAARRRHGGIPLVYFDNASGKDMKPRDIVNAICSLLSSELPVANELHILNRWR